MLQLAEALPHRMTRLVNIDGMPSPRPHPDVASHERTKLMASELSGWLDHRRTTSSLTRKSGTIDELAERRGRMNPRLSNEWLRYLVTIGAREDADGWRWKIDPALRMGGFGPCRNPSGRSQRLPGLDHPMLGLLGLVPEQMGWGTNPDELRPYLPPDGELVAFEDVGHFIHIEKPDEVCPASSSTSSARPGRRHDPPPARSHGARPPRAAGRVGPPPAAPPRPGRAVARPRPRPSTTAGPGPIFALDFTGHGASTVPSGGGYTAEMLMADVDAALAELGRGHRRRPRPRRLRRPADRRWPPGAGAGAPSSPTAPAWPAAAHRPPRRPARSVDPATPGTARPVGARRADPRPAPAGLRHLLRPSGRSLLGPGRAPDRVRHRSAGVARGRRPGARRASDAAARSAGRVRCLT